MDEKYIEVEEAIRLLKADIDNLRVALEKEKRDHDETRGYRQRAEQIVEKVRNYSHQCGILRVEPSTAGLKEALNE